MGIFDHIIVPKSYLKGLLVKEQEKLLKTAKRFGGSVRGVEFETKCLENKLRKYKIYKQKLFVNDESLWNCEAPDTEQRNEGTSKKYPYEKGRWDKVAYTGIINFHNCIEDNGNKWWAEFEFVFKNGIIDKKELVKFEVLETPQDAKITEREPFERTLKFKLYDKISKVLFKASEWAYNKTLPPIQPQRLNKKEKLSFWKHS